MSSPGGEAGREAGESQAGEESFWSGYDLLWGDNADTAATRRSPLDRTRIVRAALRVADADGLAGLTMRRVATELGTGAMSLYRHVPGKEALVSLMIDEALGEDVLPDQPSGDWRGDLRLVASMMWDFIQRHPWYPEAVMERPPITPRGLAAFEFALSILERGEYPRLREALTSDNRLDPKQEMQVSIELILDGAAARIAAS